MQAKFALYLPIGKLHLFLEPYHFLFPFFPCGMMIVTLLDVAGLVGLKPTGKLLTLEFQPDYSIAVNMSSTSYGKFI